MKYIILLFLMVSVTCFSQKWSVGVYQDISLAVSEDAYGNQPFTLDMIAKVELHGKQKRLGYIMLYPQIEYAKLSGGEYFRIAGGSGYTFNSFLTNLDITPSVNWGQILRFEEGYYSWEFQLETSYQVINHIRVALLLSETQRSEIDVWRFNVYLGLKYTI